MDDAMLIANVRAGNAAVANAFCRRVWPAVDRTVRRLLGVNNNDREDVTQLSLVEAVRSISRYRGDSSLDTWVSALTAHVVYKHLRRRPLAEHLNLELFNDTLASERMSSEQSVAHRQLLTRVLQHLEATGEKLAWCFVLHDVLGYGLTEAAEIMGVSLAAAQSRLVRGRKRLHQLIADDPELAGLLDRASAPPATE